MMVGFICDRLVATCAVGLEEARDLYGEFFSKTMLKKYKAGVDEELKKSEDEQVRQIPVQQ